jgi:hypothetical protein
VRMTVCFMEERLQTPPTDSAGHDAHLQSVLGDVQELLGKLR